MTAAPLLKDDPRTIWSWASFDWANSAFATLVVTFIYASWFTGAFGPTEEIGTQWWSWGIGISAVLIALISPILGAAADRAGTRKKYLAWSVGICALGTASLAFITPDMNNAAFKALAVFVVANVAFEVGMVFYNAFLPDIASKERIGRVSGNGWALGYAGGLLCMGVALLFFVKPNLLGLSTDGAWNIRATNLLVAAWFLIFSIPFFRNVQEPKRDAVKISIGDSFRELAQTFRQIRRYRQVFRFLVARLVFNDGLVTIFAFGGIYAADTFNLSFDQVLYFGITLNVASGLGAWLFGIVDDKVGGKQTILMTITMLIMATMVAVWAPTTTWLWVAGIMIGLFVGPNQAASRSLMGRFVPPAHQAEFFGFFAFSGKATAFMGPLLLGWATATFGSQRVGVATVMLFLAAGGLLMLSVDEAEGIEAARS
jgi:UMF1 family MFS transporter